jgi:DNA-binding beta-propeller fold protein YncE
MGGLTFGPDRDLYLASTGTDSILRFDAATGNLAGSFVVPGDAGLSRPEGIAFGPDGNLYVSNSGVFNPQLVPGNVQRYDGASGAPLHTSTVWGGRAKRSRSFVDYSERARAYDRVPAELQSGGNPL